MTSPYSRDYPEDSLTLWALTFSPAIWAAHFLLSYMAGSLWCGVFAGREGTIGPVRAGIIVLAVVALAGIGMTARRAWRSYRHDGSEAEHHRDTAEARHRFLGFAAVLLSALSAIATVYVALSTLFVRGCY